MKFECWIRIGKFRERKVIEASGDLQCRAEVEALYGKGSLISCSPISERVPQPKQEPFQKTYFPEDRSPFSPTTRGKQVVNEPPKLETTIEGIAALFGATAALGVIVLVLYIIEKIFG